MLSKKKKIISIISVAAAIAVISTISAAAYLTAQANRNNSFTVGENTISVSQTIQDQPDQLTAGCSFTQKPVVKNTNNQSCFIRTRVLFSTSQAENICESLDIQSDWTEKQSDGYYYYKKVLKPNEVTSPLFTTVTIKNDVQSKDINNFSINTYAESVGQAEFADNDYIEAFSQIA